MAVKLRLVRMGKKKQPTYRIIAADSRSPRDGRFIEILGHYDPKQEQSKIVVNNEAAVKWLRQGAQPTETVGKLLKISGAWDQFKAKAADTSSPFPAPLRTERHLRSCADLLHSLADHGHQRRIFGVHGLSTIERRKGRPRSARGIMK